MRRRAWCVGIVTMASGVTAIAATGSASPVVQPTTKYYLHIDQVQSGVGGDWELSMSTSNHADDGNGMGNTYNGVANEVFAVTGADEPRRTHFPAVDRLPLRLDAMVPAARPVTGAIAVRSFQIGSFGVSVPLGVGQAVLDLELTGTPVGAADPVTIGTETIEFLVTPFASKHVLDVRIEPDDAYHGTTFSELTLTTYFHGPAVFTGFFELDDPPSFIEIPTVRPARAR